MKIGGIYCIENILGGKKYIGQAIDLRKRKSQHFYNLKIGRHENSHLQNAYNKYGRVVFEFKILLYCEQFEFTRYEQFFVDYYGKENLYNICLECVDSSFGTRRSEESKLKMSNNHADVFGKNNPFFGKHHSEETIENLSGENNPMYGKHHSEETKEKMSSNQKDQRGEKNHRYGKSPSKETIEKMIKAHSGKHPSEKTKKKMSEARKRYWENKKQTTP